MIRVPVAVAVLAGLLLCGCTSGGTPPSTATPRPAKAALSSAGALRTDALKALTRSFPGVAWSDRGEPRVQQQADGECILFLPDAVSGNNLHEASNQMKDVPPAIAEVLAAHGFEGASEPAFAHGDAYVAAMDPLGWTLTVTSSGKSARLELSGPVQASPCDRTTLD